MVLSPWNNPTTLLTRTWCVFEIYVGIQTNARFEVAMSKTQKQTFLQDLQANENCFNKMLGTIKSANSKTAVPSDRDNIMALMKTANMTCVDLDRLLFKVLEDWIFRTIQALIDGTVLAEKATWFYFMACILCEKQEFKQAKVFNDEAIHLYRAQLDDKDVDTW
ncbi:Aste57867_25533 [Aphanomyces stellatus]|uniref:Aste57867_25533 protein n=1 Tax=Aphanomyces stellatus TaxID=120398 RepID=A0A485LTB5_9STRA|nr:hypothetical protein As57867_025454 [Aphanomyces stellatus]VFU02156.1 Aste57867_25533 [Aphanomyces stellatus]